MVKNISKLAKLKDVDSKLYNYSLDILLGEKGQDGTPVTLANMDPALHCKAVEFTKTYSISVSDLVNYLLEDYFYGVDELEEK